MTEQQLLAAALARGTAFDSRIVLYAGANLPASDVLAAYQPALSAYPAMGPSFAKEQPEVDIVSGLEQAISARICALFNATWAEPRLPSCTMANLAVFHCFGKAGDLMLGPAAAHGGHLSQRRGGTPDLAGLVVEDLPYDIANVCLDAEAAARMVFEKKPALVLLGRSVIIKPDDLAPVIAAAKAVGAKTIYDASHVLGLIAGGSFPNPLDLGVDLITSSTYKTFPGRPHAIVAGRNPQDGADLARFIDTKFMANGDNGRLPQLLMSLIDAQESIADYAAKITQTSRAMTQALRAAGITVIAPQDHETFTHQILIPLAANCPPRAAMEALQAKGVLIGTCADPTRAGGAALRLGTQYITRHPREGQSPAQIAAIFTAIFAPDDQGLMRVIG